MIVRFLIYLFGILLACYLAGMVAFAWATDERAGAAKAVSADGIVVLTGGSGERIAKGAQLLRDGKAGRLLISGVHESVRAKDIQKLSVLNVEQLSCCVDLGRTAHNTVGNALEIQQWQERHKYGHLLVVTSAYHMPRALMELRRAMPHVLFTPVPVRSVGVARSHVWRRTVNEYNKFLVVMLRASNRAKEAAS